MFATTTTATTSATDAAPAAFHGIEVRWDGIVRRFQEGYQDVFKTSKKAHLDSVPSDYRVVDGARDRWWPLLLIDAAIFLLSTKLWCFASRRAFNQHKALFDAVISEVQGSFADWLHNLPCDHNNLQEFLQASSSGAGQTLDGWQESLACSSKINLNLAVDTSCWKSFAQWKATMLSDTPSKAKLKFTLVVDYLASHPLLQGRGGSMVEMLRMVVCKVIVHYVCKLFSSEPRPPQTTPLYASLPQTFLHPRRVLAAASPPTSPSHHEYKKSLTMKDRLHSHSCRCAMVHASSSRKRLRDLLPGSGAQESFQCVYQCSIDRSNSLSQDDYPALPYCAPQPDQLDDFNLGDLDLNSSLFDDLSYEGDIISNESCVTDCDESQIISKLTCEIPISQCHSTASTPNMCMTTCSCCTSHSDLSANTCELYAPIRTFSFGPSNSAHISEQPMHYVARKMPRV